MKWKFHPKHGYHLEKSHPTKCPHCHSKIIYWECSCGSKVFFNIDDDEELHQRTCTRFYEPKIKIKRVCYDCHRSNVINMVDTGWEIIENYQSECFAKSGVTRIHTFAVLSRVKRGKIKFS